MKNVLRLSIIILLFSCNKKEDPQEQVTNDCTGEYASEEIQDTLVSAFFGLDNALPSLFLCNQQASKSLFDCAIKSRVFQGVNSISP